MSIRAKDISCIRCGDIIAIVTFEGKIYGALCIDCDLVLKEGEE